MVNKPDHKALFWGLGWPANKKDLKIKNTNLN